MQIISYKHKEKNCLDIGKSMFLYNILILVFRRYIFLVIQQVASKIAYEIFEVLSYHCLKISV